MAKRIRKPRQLDLFTGKPIVEEKAKSSDVTLADFQGSTVQIVMKDGDPWWVAADVCKALDIINVIQAVNRLDEDEKGVSSVYTLGGPQEMAIINESGLYRLIFTSRKAEAEIFRRWVTREVLPTIRKTGRYEVKTSRQRRAERAMGTKDVATVKTRLDLATRHRRVNRKLADEGFTRSDLVRFHNVKYREWTEKTAAELRKEIGCTDSPLNHMSGLMLALNEHALAITERVAEFRAEERGHSLTPAELAELYGESLRDMRESDIRRLGPDFVYGVTEDPNRGRILDVIRQLPVPA